MDSNLITEEHTTVKDSPGLHAGNQHLQNIHSLDARHHPGGITSQEATNKFEWNGTAKICGSVSIAETLFKKNEKILAFMDQFS